MHGKDVTLIDGTNASPGRKMTIEATCLTKDSVPVCSRLNFEDCYSDVNGMLIPTAAGEECYACEGRFPDSCKGCHFEKNPHHFVCECLRDDGGWSRAEVDISKLKSNRYTFLVNLGISMFSSGQARQID